MARIDERLSKILKKISKTHKPFDKDGKYSLQKSKKAQAIVNTLNKKMEFIIDDEYGIVVTVTFQ